MIEPPSPSSSPAKQRHSSNRPPSSTPYIFFRCNRFLPFMTHSPPVTKNEDQAESSSSTNPLVRHTMIKESGVVFIRKIPSSLIWVFHLFQGSGCSIRAELA
ncbi:hypothetical protein L6452_39455 [Arctium lappa]|uniref:Uncharacterized protein n=1 Tax=Arctium lappa TaxID=4217 RepID=A0ACB8XWH3_ARCLA|nr:hypothetical protein L6452_39455 [Arctium lappa]